MSTNTATAKGPLGALIRQTHTDYKTDTGYTALNLISLPIAVTVKDGGGSNLAITSYGYDGQSLTSCPGIVQLDRTVGTARGNQTTVTRWLHYPGENDTNVMESFTYDEAGNVRSHTDGRQLNTMFDFSSSTDSTFAFPTTITNALSQSVQYVWDINIGRPTSYKDANLNTTTLVYGDSLDRLTWADEAGKRQRSYSYSDAYPPTVDATVGGVHTRTVFDCGFRGMKIIIPS